jgi:hypothetical protein
MRKPGSGKPPKRRAHGESRVAGGGPPDPDPSAAPNWCVHCYQVLKSVRARRAHRCPEKLLAGGPSSPAPYN